ncbi:hypothetical protein CR513_59316, partial [Mucuna pruriens]
MNTIICCIPPFVGDGDVESYLDWENKVDQVLACFDYLDYEKVRMIIYEFIGSKSVQDYHRDMEVALTRANVLEYNKAIMSHFLHGLNRDIQDIREYHYDSLDNLVHQEIRERILPGPVLGSKSSNIKCFKCLSKGHITLHCPNKRSIIMKEDGIVDSDSSIIESSSKSDSNASCEYSQDVEGDLLIMRRLMIITDGSNSVNVASSRLVEKLKLPTLAHPKPYKLQWLNREGELVVTKQVSPTFVLGKYEDVVLCDVIPIEATHILLGRS